MLSLTYSAHCVLPDGSTLLAVVETMTERRWFRDVVTSETRSYVLKSGHWWGTEGAIRHSDPRHYRLSEIAMEQVVRKSVDAVFTSVS